jgi:hypothetical protein
MKLLFIFIDFVFIIRQNLLFVSPDFYPQFIVTTWPRNPGAAAIAQLVQHAIKAFEGVFP